MSKIASIRLLIVFEVIMILTGCASNSVVLSQAKQAQLERLKKACDKCEDSLPGQCSVGKYGSCTDIFGNK